MVGEQQGACDKGTGCADQIFSSSGEEAFGERNMYAAAFTYSEMAQDSVDRQAMWKVLKGSWRRWEAAEDSTKLV